MKKYDAVRWGQLDGERYAMRWIEQSNPTRDELEWKLTSSPGKDDTEDAAQYQGADRRSGIDGRSREWYVAAFVSEARKFFQRAYNEAPPSENPTEASTWQLVKADVLSDLVLAGLEFAVVGVAVVGGGLLLYKLLTSSSQGGGLGLNAQLPPALQNPNPNVWAPGTSTSGGLPTLDVPPVPLS
jgi:hypothetical protein